MFDEQEFFTTDEVVASLGIEKEYQALADTGWTAEQLDDLEVVFVESLDDVR